MCAKVLWRFAARTLPVVVSWLYSMRSTRCAHRESSCSPPLKLTSATRQNLWRLTFIRTLVLAAQAGFGGLAYWFDLLPLPWLQLGVTLGFSIVLCVFTGHPLAHYMAGRLELEYALQLACDLFIHSALLYFSGGSTNPFVSYYLVPLTIAAVTLPWRYSVVLSGIALTLYTSALLAQFYPLQTFPIARENLQVYGMWLSFALSAAVITFFAARMAEELRRQEELRAIRREEGLRDQQLLAVATQAAGAAHELGTPLATMSVLLERKCVQDHPTCAAGRPGRTAGAGQAVQADLAATGARRRSQSPPGGGDAGRDPTGSTRRSTAGT